MRKITTFAFLLLVVLIGSFIGCERVQQVIQPTVSQMEGDREEILIGAVYPITGRFSSADATIEHSVELAVEEINYSQDNPVEIRVITEDDRSSVAGAVEAFNKLIYQDQVSVILGPGSSSQVSEAFPIAQ